MSNLEKLDKERPEKSRGQDNAPDIRRRKLLQVAFTAGAVVAVGGPALRDYVKEEMSGKELLESIAEKRQQIENTWGVKVILAKPGDLMEYGYENSELNLAQKERGLTLLLKELAKLPPVLIKDSPIKSISLCAGLQAANAPLGNRIRVSNQGGIFYKNPDDTGKKLVLNVGGNFANMYNLFGWEEGITSPRKFAHELFHSIDKIDNDEWEALQRGKYRYVRPEARTWVLENKDLKVSGFARLYGLLNPKEDKATVYEALSAQDEYRDILKRSLRDPVLDKKVMVIKAYIRDSSLGLMDESYWTDVFTGRVGPEYFRVKAQALLSESTVSYCARHPDVSETTFSKWQARLRQEYSVS